MAAGFYIDDGYFKLCSDTIDTRKGPEGKRDKEGSGIIQDPLSTFFKKNVNKNVIKLKPI